MFEVISFYSDQFHKILLPRRLLPRSAWAQPGMLTSIKLTTILSELLVLIITHGKLSRTTIPFQIELMQAKWALFIPPAHLCFSILKNYLNIVRIRWKLAYWTDKIL